MPQTGRQDDFNQKVLKMLARIFVVLAVLCILYFIIIIIYAGFQTAYCFIWPVFAIGFLSMGYYSIRASRHQGGMPRFLSTFVFTSFGLFMCLFAMIMSAVIASTRPDSPVTPKADYIIVPGARVYSNGVSMTLMLRLEQALRYNEYNPDVTFVLSGGLDKGDAIPEALAMYNFMSMNGVPSSRMIMDTRGKTTSDIISRAVRKIYADAEIRKTPLGPGDIVWPKDYEPRIGVLTSDYHIMRSVRILEKNGVNAPIAIPAGSDKVMFLHQCVRESAAVLRDFLMGRLG